MRAETEEIEGCAEGIDGSKARQMQFKSHVSLLSIKKKTKMDCFFFCKAACLSNGFKVYNINMGEEMDCIASLQSDLFREFVKVSTIAA